MEASIVPLVAETKTENNSIWQQKDIAAGKCLYGFFEFQYGLDKRSNEPFCNLTGASKLNILRFVGESGYRKRYLEGSNNYILILERDNKIEPVTIDLIRIAVFNNLLKHREVTITYKKSWKFKADLLQTIYLKNQDQIFNKNFLELLPECTTPELKDTKETAYFPFQNGIISVTKDGFSFIDYPDLQNLNMCVWLSHILQREYRHTDVLQPGEFEKFINNISNHEESRIRAFKSALGYLQHNHNGSHMGYAVFFYDQKPTDSKNPQGGTGKGVITQSLSYQRETPRIDGKHFKSDDRFRFQAVNATSQIVIIDDLAKEVGLEPFFSALTDGFTIEKKHQDSIKLTPENSPKMAFSMNTVINGNGSSHRRRMFVVELSDYYSSKIKTGVEHPVEDEHGILFDRFKWTNTDWNTFTRYMLECVQFYLKYDLQPYELINVSQNLLIQTTGEDFANWATEKDFKLGFRYNTKDFFEEYSGRYYGGDPSFRQRTFTNLLGKYADSKGLKRKIETNNSSKTSQFFFISNS